jgi:hypothetical protein
VPPTTAALLQHTYRETRTVPLAELRGFPGNAQDGDVPAIVASIKRHGQFRSLIVQDRGDGDLVVVAGNHTMLALGELGQDTARCEIHDMDDDLAERVNIIDNRAAQLGVTDPVKLLAQIERMDGDLQGLAMTFEDVDDLRALAEEHMPELPAEDPAAVLQLGRDDEDDDEGDPADGADGDDEEDEPAESGAYTQTRAIVLTYPAARYAWMVEQLGKLIDEHGVETNAAAAVIAVEKATGLTCPAGHGDD